ncbi:TPA: ead/Ea22-like family protein [Citrobacter koseri]|uniref:ead/Ea22-like family protein n=1 Tax=Citrobacter koseri TaxID=545 RepID=UPI00388FD0A8|nr:ead/Ea22-like family protein [Citrobacter koseri]
MTIDKQSLREAAEKALPAMKRLLMMPNDELFDEALLNVDGDVDAANAFNLLTGPETVLALLDELEALQYFRTAFNEWHDKTEWVQGDKRFDVIKPWGKHRADVLKLYIDHLESKLEAKEEQRANWFQMAQKLGEDLDAAEKCIAELESRTVTLEPFRSFVTDADITALHRFAECCDDHGSGGHDLKKEQVRRLEAIGALQRSGRISYITDFGDVLISITAGIGKGE